MKIKRFTAANMQVGMKLISDALGPEAVILSNRRKGKELEIVAGVDEQEFELYVENNPAALEEINAIHDSSSASSSLPTGNSESRSHSMASRLTDSDIIKANPDSAAAALNVETMQQLFGAMAEKNKAAFADQKTLAEPEPHSRSPRTFANESSANYGSAPQTVSKAKLAQSNSQFNDHANTESNYQQITPPSNSNTEVLKVLRQEIDGLKDLLKEQTDQLTKVDSSQISPQYERIEARLSALGFSKSMLKRLLAHHDKEDSLDQNWRKIMGRLTSAIPVPLYEPLQNGGVYAFTGPTGAGKTTTIAKLAAHGVKDFGSENVAVISLDWYQVCGQEILRSVTDILDVDFHPLSETDSLLDKIQQMSQKKLILIDTSGAIEATKHFNALMKDGALMKIVQTLLVLPANMHPAAVSQFTQEQIKTPLTSVILSKLDESLSFGGVLEPVLKNKWPIWYCTNGQEIPKDIELCDSKKLVKRLLKALQSENSNFAVAS